MTRLQLSAQSSIASELVDNVHALEMFNSLVNELSQPNVEVTEKLSKAVELLNLSMSLIARYDRSDAEVRKLIDEIGQFVWSNREL